MKVLIATYQSAFFCPGGGEQQLLRTYDAMKEYNIDVELFDYYNTEKISKCDIIHIFSVCYGLEALINAAKDSQKKIAVSPIHWPKNIIPDSHEYNRIRHILLQADIIMPNSQAEANYLNRFYCLNKPQNFHVVCNGLSNFYLNHAYCYQRINKKIDETKVLFCGNIEERKNIIRLAKAVNCLGYKLTLAGRVRDKKILDEMTINNYNYTHIDGYQNESIEHLQLMNEHDIFCLPSHYETPGLAALEACVFGLKTVVSQEGCTQEYFKQQAIYCDPNSTNSIVHALRTAANETKNLLRPEGLENLYTWNNAALQTIEGYRKLS